MQKTQLSQILLLAYQLIANEFAGIKYKVKASTPSGKHFVQSIQDDVLLKYTNYLPAAKSTVICKEKY